MLFPKQYNTYWLAVSFPNMTTYSFLSQWLYESLCIKAIKAHQHENGNVRLNVFCFCFSCIDTLEKQHWNWCELWFFLLKKKHWICVNRSVNNIGNDYLFNSDSSKVEQKLWINLSSSDAERHKAILQILEKGRNKAYKADETPLERRWTAFQQQRRVYFVCSTYFTLHVPQTHSPVALFTQWYKNSDRSSWLIRS